MVKVETDQNLLFGILAVQMDFISRDDLIAAMGAWVLEKDKPLDRVLRERGALTEARRALLEAMVREHLAAHDDDPQRSLDAVGVPGAVCDDLARVADPDVQATLGRVSSGGTATEDGHDGTALWHVGAATSTGSRFLVLRPLAKGGIGLVSVALDAELHREVALKEIQPEHADDPASRARFLLEAEVTGRLEHPGVIPVYGLGSNPRGQPFYAMRLVRGDSLKEAIDRFHADDEQVGRRAGRRALGLRKLLARFLDVCNAIAYAHSRGVIHRDIKPSNVLLGPYGETLVVDWGLAKVIGRDEPRAGESTEVTLRPATISGSGSSATVAGTAIGTPSFMSPEQAEGRLNELGPASDIYGLGATLYCLLTGRPPVEGRDLAELLRQVQRGEIPPARAVNARVAPALEAVCRKAMAVRPVDRYASARALAEDIEHWLADEPVSAWREPPTARLARWGRRHKPVLAGGVLLLVIAVAGLAASTALIRREQRETDRQRANAVAKSVEVTEKADALERQVYIKGVNLAYRECLLNNIASADRLLDDCPPARRGWEWSYCRRLCHGESLTLGGQDYGSATDVAISRDGVWVLSAGNPAAVLWDARTGRELRRFRGHRGQVLRVAISPDLRWVATAGEDTTVRLWDAASARAVHTLRGHTHKVTGLAFSPDGTRLVSGAGCLLPEAEPDRTAMVIIWETETGRELHSVPIDGRNEVTLDISPDGKRIATSALWYSTLNLIDAATGRRIARVPEIPLNKVLALAFSPDGTRVAVACADVIKLCDPAARTVLREFRGHAGLIKSLSFSPDGKRIASASEDGTIRLWDPATGEELAHFRGHSSGVEAVKFSPDGSWLASASYDQTVKLWSVPPREDVVTFRHPYGWALRAKFRPDGRQLAMAFYGDVRLRDAATWQEVRLIRPDKGSGFQGLAYSPDGRRVATTHEFSKLVEVWDAASGQRLLACTGHTDFVRDVAFSPDGTWLASASEDHTVKLWNAADGRELRTLAGHTEGVFALAIDPDGRRIASIGWDSTVRLWDAASGQEVHALSGVVQHPSVFLGNAVAFSKDGRRLAAASDDGTVVVWDAATGRRLFTLRGHTSEVNTVAFSPVGRRIATASADATVKLWDAETGDELFTLRGHTNCVLGVTFDPDGHRIASASGDGTVKVWDATPGSPPGAPGISSSPP